MKFFNTFVILGAMVLLTGTTVPSMAQQAPQPKDESPGIADVAFDPENPETGDELKVNFKFKEPALRAEIKWTVNDEEVGPGKYDEMSTSAALGRPIKDGDKVKVEITPFDGEGNEGQVASKIVTVRNAPPDLKLVGQRLEGGTYKAKVEAKDPEGGEVNLDLEGPPGMKIDHKGNITWKLKGNEAGKFNVKITAKDDKGAQAVLTYSLGIRR